MKTREIVHAGIRIKLRERSTSRNGNIVMTQLLLSHHNNNLTVMHYQWTSWADHKAVIRTNTTSIDIAKLKT